METVAEITERLRKGVQTAPGCSHPIASDIDAADALMSEAADTIVRLSDAEARIRELEAVIEQMKADHACELADMATRFRAVNVERLSEQLGADIFALRDRAEAAEALLKEAREALEPFTKYAQDECFKGSTKWELVECDRPGGAWFGAEDFRAARAIHHKIGVKDE